MTTKKLLTPSKKVIEKRRAYARKYYKSHKARARKYSKANAEKIRARAAQWRKDNRERYLMQQAMYDLTRRGRMHPEDRIRRAYKYLYKPGPHSEDDFPSLDDSLAKRMPDYDRKIKKG